MVAVELSENASLTELLSARARRTPRDRLTIDILGGIAVLAAALWARPAGWLVISAAAVCFAAYGTWALAEVRLLPQPEPVVHVRWWRALRATAGVIGLAAYVVLLFAALGLAFGRQIS